MASIRRCRASAQSGQQDVAAHGVLLALAWARGGCQAGGDDGARGEGVAAHDVDGDQLRPPLRFLDAGFAGVAGGGDLAGVGFEVLEADPGAAPDQARSPTWSAGSTGPGTAVPTGCASGFRRTPAGAGAVRSRTRPGGSGTGGSTAARTAAEDQPARMISAQMTVTARARARKAPAPMARTASSVRNRQIVPAARVMHLGGEAVQDVGVVAVVARVGLARHQAPLPVTGAVPVPRARMRPR